MSRRTDWRAICWNLLRNDQLLTVWQADILTSTSHSQHIIMADRAPPPWLATESSVRQGACSFVEAGRPGFQLFKNAFIQFYLIMILKVNGPNARSTRTSWIWENLSKSRTSRSPFISWVTFLWMKLVHKWSKKKRKKVAFHSILGY